jgi:hypothetical protein
MIKYPRVVVSVKRHEQLTRAAKKAKVNIATLVESVFVKAFKK